MSKFNFILLTTQTTEKLPIKFWIVLILVFISIYFLGYKFLSKLYIPKDGENEAPAWKDKDDIDYG